MKRRMTDWRTDFPILEIAEDFAGKQRKFVINCHEGGFGYTVRASEEGKDGLGYQFAAYSETTPYAALGRVREKLSRGLATRHITGTNHVGRRTWRGAGRRRGPAEHRGYRDVPPVARGLGVRTAHRRRA
jgi:hypothetical protein